MTNTEPPPAPADPIPEGPATEEPSAAPTPRLRRATDGHLGGVATGIARYTNIDVNVIYAAFIVSAFFAGFGVFAYIAAWILLPDDRNTDPRPFLINGGLIPLVAGGLAALAALGLILGPSGVTSGLLGPILLIAFGVFLLNQRDLLSTPSSISPPPRAAGPPPPSAARTDTSTGTAMIAPPPPGPSAGNAPPRWGSILTDETPSEPAEPKPPRAPVTAITLAVCTIVLGVLALADHQDWFSVTPLLVIGSMLLLTGGGIAVGAVTDRAVGLYPIAVLAILALFTLPFSTAVRGGGVGSRSYEVQSPAELQSAYSISMGTIDLDLQALHLTEDRTVSVEAGMGQLTVRLNAETNVIVDMRSGAGNLEAPDGRHDDGIGARLERASIVDPDAPTLTLEMKVGLGSAIVERVGLS